MKVGEVAQVQAAKGQEPRAKGEPLTLLYVGRLIAWKGVHLGLRTLAGWEDKTLRYRIIGEGSLRVWLEAEGQRLGIANRVEFCGALPRDQVLQAYAQADGLLCPSLHDSGGNAVIEAMCTGLPILCLDCGGPGWIVSEECGRKVEASEPEAVVVQLAQVLMEFSREADERSVPASAARQRALELFAWVTRGKQFCRYVAEV